VSEPDLDASLVASIPLKNLAEAVADVTEVGLDRLLGEGLLRDIPVLGVLIQLRKTVGVVRDHIFARKVLRFLLRLAEVPVSEREAFIAGLNTVEERRRLGETLVLLLDRLDDMAKPEMLAKLFAAHLRGRCDWPTFRRLSLALERLPLPALPSLRSFYDPARRGFALGGEDLTTLAACGLVGLQFFPSDAMTGGSFGQTDLGKVLLEILDAV